MHVPSSCRAERKHAEGKRSLQHRPSRYSSPKRSYATDFLPAPTRPYGARWRSAIYLGHRLSTVRQFR